MLSEWEKKVKGSKGRLKFNLAFNRTCWLPHGTFNKNVKSEAQMKGQLHYKEKVRIKTRADFHFGINQPGGMRGSDFEGNQYICRRPAGSGGMAGAPQIKLTVRILCSGFVSV